MDEEGFKANLEQDTSSEAVIKMAIAIVKQFEYTMKTFYDLDNVDLAEENHLYSFGGWLSKEKVIDKYISAYSRYVGKYYIFTSKPKLATIAKNRFRRSEK